MYNYFCSDGNAEKEDIYQLGVLLVQVITGKLATFSSELDELKLQVCSSFVPLLHGKTFANKNH